MPSGGRRMQINSQERAVSTDINRLQAFIARDRQELFRYVESVSAGTDDIDAGSLDTEYLTQENPLRGQIYNGLLVQPQGGSLNLLVTPGAASVVDPDSVESPDDSVFKFITDAGVQTLGSLTMTSNASGQIRIDVIECQRNEVIVETDNRDIFNPVTGLFAPTSVTKGTQSQFTYRVRTGTPGSGFPGTAQGWMPIAVASVPTGTTSNDTITFWDVRPLLNDRIYPPFKLLRGMPWRGESIASVYHTGGTSILVGMFEASSADRRLGGEIRPGVPLTDAAQIDLMAAANQAPGQTPTANSFWYLYLLTPFGLPRWARYTDGPSGRQPRSPRGIPVVSNVESGIGGVPTAVALPTITGLGGTSSAGVLIAVGQTDGSSNLLGLTVCGKVQYSASDVIIAGSNASDASTFVMGSASGVGMAKALHVAFKITSDAMVADSFEDLQPSVEIQDNSGHIIAVIPGQGLTISNPTGSSQSLNWGFLARLPVFTSYPLLTGLFQYQVIVRWVSGTTATASSMRIYGWEL